VSAAMSASVYCSAGQPSSEHPGQVGAERQVGGRADVPVVEAGQAIAACGEPLAEGGGPAVELLSEPGDEHERLAVGRRRSAHRRA
jgi:hypothetical protein